MTATDQPRTSQGRQFPAVLALLIGIVLGAVAFSLFAREATTGLWNRVAAYATGRSLAIDTSVPTVVDKIRHLERLETVVYSMDKIVEGDRESPILPDFLVGDKLLLVVHGEVIAGIDLSQIQSSDIQIHGKDIQVHLPAAQVFVTSLDNTRTRVYSRTTGLLVPADPNLESEVRAQAQQQLLQAALADGVLNKARQNARTAVTTMLLGLGFQKVQVN
ncbi:MAG TPA: DUF4230 domain-containing protein [Acidobacteriaceae bacterium]|jgi:hypothetical protein|nr:DUF4230 domain-containing protein [Acidobacteriaceae bacterium]